MSAEYSFFDAVCDSFDKAAKFTSFDKGLLEQIKAILSERLGASSGELASLAALVASRIDLSLSLLLRAA